MASPSINSAVDHTAIAQAIQVTLDGDPLSCVCPLCCSGRLYALPEYERGGSWWACGVCKWTGTSISLYQALKRLPDVKTAWLAIMQDTGCSPEAHLAGDIPLLSYIQWESKVRAIQNIIEQSKDYLSSELPARSVKLLAEMGGWGGYTASTMRHGMGRLIGAVNTGHIRRLENEGGVDMRGMWRGFNNALVLPFETLPGRVSALLFKGNTQEKCISLLPDGGLLGLSDVFGLSEDVIVVFQPETYLALQKDYLKDENEAMPVVCCASRRREGAPMFPTGNAFESLHHPRVIFWDYGNSVEVINYSRRLRDRGFIAQIPDMPDMWPSVDVTVKYNAHQFLARVRQSAIPWITHLKDQLLSIPPNKASELVSQLYPALDSGELDLLEASCSEVEWARINATCERSGAVQVFKYENRTLLYRPGLGWYEVKKNVAGEGTELRVSDAIMQINEVMVVSGNTQYAGSVLLGNKSVAFVETEPILRKDPAGFMTQLCIANGLGVPKIGRKWRNQLLDIALAYKAPKVATNITKVGWNAFEKQWEFPAFNVKEGAIDIHGAVMPNLKGVPAANLLPHTNFPRPSLVEDWCIDSSTTNLALALVAAITANLAAPALGKPKKGIMLYRAGQAAEVVVNELGAQLGLISYGRARPNQTQLDTLVEGERAHDLPVVILNDKFDGNSWASWMKFLGPRNCIVTPRKIDAINMCLTGGWYLIDASGDDIFGCDPKLIRNLGSFIPLYLRRLAHALPSFQGYDSLAWYVASDMLDYLSQGHPTEMPPKVVANVLGRIHAQPVNLWERFLWALFYAITEGKIDVAAPKQGKGDPSLGYRGDGTIVVNWRGLSKIKRAGLWLPEPDTLDDAMSSCDKLKQIDGGWIVPRELWNESFITWRALFDTN